MMPFPHFGDDAKQSLAAAGGHLLIVEMTPDGKFVSVNDLCCDFVGLDRASLIGRRHSVVVEADDSHNQACQEFLARLRRGEVCTGEFRRIGKDGKEMRRHGSYNPVFDLDPRVVKIVKFAADATGRVMDSSKSGQG